MKIITQEGRRARVAVTTTTTRTLMMWTMWAVRNHSAAKSGVCSAFGVVTRNNAFTSKSSANGRRTIRQQSQSSLSLRPFSSSSSNTLTPRRSALQRLTMAYNSNTDYLDQDDQLTLPVPSASSAESENNDIKVNIHTIAQSELETLLKAWGHPKYRAKQILNWVRQNGAETFDDMSNLPQKLKTDLEAFATIGSLKCVEEQVSQKDGTIKRAYALHDGQLIESVLMPYDDGRYTACISSQAGCAMGCVFCATGQMGFARQLTADEIFEQVALFDSQLKKKSSMDAYSSSGSTSAGQAGRVSNVVMMGMGEPLANYRNVLKAIRRMNDELGIGARKITISTVGVVPSIRKLMAEDIQVRLAISLHCATEEERNKLLPANKRYGGLAELLDTAKEYTLHTKRRITFEWALIEGENDTAEVARTLGNALINDHGFRRDFVHINVIPLNPTGGFAGSPSQKKRVDAFTNILKNEFGISATPRVRRGIDIDAGCGQLKSAVEKKKKQDDLQLEEAESEVEEVEAVAEVEAQAVAEAQITTDTVILDNNVNVADESESETRTELEDMLYDFSHELKSTTTQDEHVDEQNKNEEIDIGTVAASIHHDPSATNAIPTHHSFVVDEHALNFDWDEEDDFEDEVWDSQEDKAEISRLMSFVQSKAPPSITLEISDGDSPATTPTIKVVKTTSIVDEDVVRDAKKRRKKLLKHLKMIDKLKSMKDAEGEQFQLNAEQILKVSKEEEFRTELESVEHNMQ
jgi:23S rRNA (adenine2503-C2)-methyltransferase